MAAIRFYQNGAGGSTGADLAVLRPTYTSGNYWYVHKSGSDANAGTERIKPLASTTQALAYAQGGDTVVYLPGHTENIPAGYDLARAGLKIVSEGLGAQRAALTQSYIGYIFKVDATGILIDNIYFPPSSGVGTERIQVASTFSYIDNCTFDSGANDTARSVSYITGAGSCAINNSTFTAVAAGASIGIQVVNAMTGLKMNNITFDGSSFGWTDYALKGSAAVTNLRATRISQLNGSHILLPTGTTGSLQQQASTGDSRVDWTA